MKMQWMSRAILAMGVFAGLALAAWAADPVIANVSASQRAGTKLVDVNYDLTSSCGTNYISITISTNSGANYNLPAIHFTGAYGIVVGTGAGKQIIWDAAGDWNGMFSSQIWFKITAREYYVPQGVVSIPAGTNNMGDTVDSFVYETPVHSVTLSAFYMDKTEVTGALWDEVYQWACAHGYVFSDGDPGRSKYSDHPVQYLNWYDSVKWCNARSEKEGFTPCYYTSSAKTNIYRTSETNILSDCVNWSTNGYRLPTEAEWEKAARGGVAGLRFPWGDTISHAWANYYAVYFVIGSYYITYELGPLGYHASFTNGVTPYTSPVGSFSANDYGLYDMIGNVAEWCWDLYSNSYYSTSPSIDPTGPTNGTQRAIRGGCWEGLASGGNKYGAEFVRSSYRYESNYSGFDYSVKANYIGFRCVRRP